MDIALDTGFKLATYAFLFVVSLYGMGLGLSRLIGWAPKNEALHLVAGMGLLLFVGGVLNVFHIAWGWIFDGVLLIGAAIALKLGGRQLRSATRQTEWRYWSVMGLVVLAIMAYTIGTQLHPDAYNYHDDYQKYFAHPVRMLQTGTLFGSPLSAVGSETLGGQAILHGILLNHFPVTYLNGVDAVFGFFLCLLLVVNSGVASYRYLPFALMGVFLLLFINPQYVNISALYIAVAFMMTGMMLVGDNQASDTALLDDMPPPFLLGMTYASLIALKSSYLLFPVFHFSFLMAARGISNRGKPAVLQWGTRTIAFTCVFLSPWIMLHLPHYLRSSASALDSGGVVLNYYYSALLSWEPLFHGSSLAHYTYLSIAILVLTGVLFFSLPQNRDLPYRTYLAGVGANTATVIISYIAIMSFSSMLNGYATNLRYAIPYLVAGSVVIFLQAARVAISIDTDRGSKARMAAMLIGILILVSFAGSMVDRVQNAIKYGSALAFSQHFDSQDYVAYHRDVLHGRTKQRLAIAQDQIPPGRKIVAFVMTPFYFNYERNIIYDVEPAGIANPWAYIPRSEYFIIEYRGYAVSSINYYIQRMQNANGRRERQIAKRCIAFYNYLQEVEQKSEPVYNDGRIVVLKTNELSPDDRERNKRKS